MYRAFAEPFVEPNYKNFAVWHKDFDRKFWVSKRTLDRMARGDIPGMDVLDAICTNEGQGIVKMREYSKKVLVGGD